MGFSEVYDFVDGKIEWLGHGLPMEGKGPHFAVAGEVADRDAVLACRLGDRLGDVAQQFNEIRNDYCVVLNDQDVVLGRIRKKHLEGPPDTGVEHIMEPGPTTVRPTEPAGELLERMRQRRVPALIVTTNKGRLMGVATQDALARLTSARS